MSKLDGIKAGDKVRITFEGEVSCPTVSDPILVVNTDGNVIRFWVNDTKRDTFSIEKIEPPIAVGDRVTWNRNTDRKGDVVKIHGLKAWVFDEFGGGDVRVYWTSELERLS